MGCQNSKHSALDDATEGKFVALGAPVPEEASITALKIHLHRGGWLFFSLRLSFSTLASHARRGFPSDTFVRAIFLAENLREMLEMLENHSLVLAKAPSSRQHFLVLGGCRLQQEIDVA